MPSVQEMGICDVLFMAPSTWAGGWGQGARACLPRRNQMRVLGMDRSCVTMQTCRQLIQAYAPHLPRNLIHLNPAISSQTDVECLARVSNHGSDVRIHSPRFIRHGTHRGGGRRGVGRGCY